jgi:hypothetical protein
MESGSGGSQNSFPAVNDAVAWSWPLTSRLGMHAAKSALSHASSRCGAQQSTEAHFKIFFFQSEYFLIVDRY